MTGPSETVTIGAAVSSEADPLLSLPMRQKVVLVMDLVESVRLMAADETAVIAHWRGFLQFAIGEVLPRRSGRLVKSLGDGFMAEFDLGAQAVMAALELHRFFDAVNAGLPPERKLLLRAGANATHVYVDDVDIYGSGVNLAARVGSLAGPGETYVTAAVRDQVVDQLTCGVEDLGECYLKHVDAPVRVYRVGPPGPRPTLPARKEYASPLLPGVAVVPFTAIHGTGDPGMALGDALADDIISALSRTTSLRVISRLSTAPFRMTPGTLQDFRSLLDASYVVTGSCAVAGHKVNVRAQLCSTTDGRILWADGMSGTVEDIFHGQDLIVPSITANVGRAILQAEVERARLLPIPTLNSYTLYVGSITMLHRLSVRDFNHARELLQHLAYLYPRRAAPQAMLAKWHLLRAMQGWSADAKHDGSEALAHAQRALDLEPDNALALAMKGILLAHFSDDLTSALQLAREATIANPQEPHGWLHLAAAKMWSGEVEGIEEDTQHALSLSPLDPARFGFEAFMAFAKLMAGKYEEAATLSRNSIRLNASHPPAHRVLTLALAFQGDLEGSRRAAKDLLRLQPHLTVSRYTQTYPGRHAKHAAPHMEALRSAGIPD